MFLRNKGLWFESNNLESIIYSGKKKHIENIGTIENMLNKYTGFCMQGLSVALLSDLSSKIFMTGKKHTCSKGKITK